MTLAHYVLMRRAMGKDVDRRLLQYIEQIKRMDDVHVTIKGNKLYKLVQRK